MVNKNYLLFFTSGIAAIILSSCSTSIDIAKRQHRPGYYISLGSKTNTPSGTVASTTETVSSEASTPPTNSVKSSSNSSTPSSVEIPLTAEAKKTAAGSPDRSFTKNTSSNNHQVITLPFLKHETVNQSMKMKDDGTALWSILSFIFSILGLIPIPISMLVMGLLAIIFGLIGVNQKAKWLAIIGIIGGILEVLVGYVLFSLVLALF